MIGIIDIGCGNIGSIQRMLNYISVQSTIVNSKTQFQQCSKIIFPGMGAFDRCVHLLHQSSIRDELEKFVLLKNIPFLGVCVGMQILTEGSEEGDLAGLGWIRGYTKKLDQKIMLESQPVPHIGWRDVSISKTTKLTCIEEMEPRFYFAHSYHVCLDDREHEWMSVDYGYNFTAALHTKNIYAVQFHPEKSHRFGIELLKGFSQLE